MRRRVSRNRNPLALEAGTVGGPNSPIRTPRTPPKRPSFSTVACLPASFSVGGMWWNARRAAAGWCLESHQWRR
ncbi:hypothetical protein GE21DRAFT_1284984 [Neurospora crassa]|nr:hypothetical protein GE21DRAFT_1284984 [Neurospora crassa]